MSYLLSREKDSLREGMSFEMFKSIQQLQINVFFTHCSIRNERENQRMNLSFCVGKQKQFGDPYTCVNLFDYMVCRTIWFSVEARDLSTVAGVWFCVFGFLFWFGFLFIQGQNSVLV